MSVASIFGKLYSVITALTSIIVIAVIVLVGKEYIEPVSKYFTHFGDITVAEVYMYPQEIELYSFGATVKPSAKLDAVHRLYCVSADSLSREWVLIGTEYTIIDSESMVLNSLPTAVKAMAITRKNPVSDLGSSTRHKFVAMSSDGHAFYSWYLGAMHPSESSGCYIESTITAKSRLFHLSKSITFKTGEFSYLYP